MKAAALARKIAELTLTKKARHVIIMDLRPLTSMTDFFVVCSADSDIQVRAIADAVEEGLEKKEMRAWHKEVGSSNWVLLDYVDVVLHIFNKTARTYYNLERLWGDADIKEVSDKPRSVSRKREVVAAARGAAGRPRKSKTTAA